MIKSIFFCTQSGCSPNSNQVPQGTTDERNSRLYETIYQNSFAKIDKNVINWDKKNQNVEVIKQNSGKKEIRL